MAWIRPLQRACSRAWKRYSGRGHRPETAVARLLAEVRNGGDAAIREWTKRIDGIERRTW